MTKRLSLRGQMTISYLLVTAAAVLVAEVIILAVVFPQALGEANHRRRRHSCLWVPRISSVGVTCGFVPPPQSRR